MPASARRMLAFGEKHLDAYKQLGDKLGKIANRDQFMIAMCWGFRNGTRAQEFKRSNTGLRIEYMKPEDEAILAAIQYYEAGDTDALADEEGRYMLAEQYAEGGIMLLADMMDQAGDFNQALAAEIKSELDKLGGE
jgi:hypothetical protein